MSAAASTQTRLLRGRYGCILEATPARIYNQFSNFALASLIYDFVAVEWIRAQSEPEVDGQHIPGRIAHMSKAFLECGLCIDPWDIHPITSVLMARDDFSKEYPSATQKQWEFNQDFGGVYAPAHRLLARKTKQDPPNPQDEMLALFDMVQKVERAFHRFRFKLGITALGYELDDGKLLDEGVGDQHNDLLKPLIDAGHIPLVAAGSSPSSVLHKGEMVKMLQLFIRNVPFPTEMPLNEFVDFRNSKIVRNSIGQFRQHVKALIGDQAPANYVIEELVEQYEAYKREVARMKARTHLNAIKFVITSVAGTVEDIVKLRLENLSKRPYEIAEWFLDKKYEYKEHESSPFFFAIEKDLDQQEH
jgi:hypothetical protein